MASNVVYTDLVNEYGSYYVPEGQNLGRIAQSLRKSSLTAAIARKVITDATQWNGSYTTMTELIQSFQKAWTPKSTLTFKPKVIQLFNLKADFEFHPDDMKANWLGFLASNDLDRKQWPFVRYIVEFEFMNQINHDRETKGYFTGDYSAPTPSTAGDAINAITGVKKLLDDGITATTINEVSLSNDPSDPTKVFDAIEEFVTEVDDELFMEDMILCMSPLKKVQYFRDKRNTHGTVQTYKESEKLTVDAFPNIEIVGLQSMAGSDYIWMTPRKNFVHVTKGGPIQAPRIENVDRQVKLYTDWWEGLGFVLDELVYAYTPDESGS